MFNYKTTTKCRLCKSEDLETVYDMGKHYVVAFIPENEEQEWRAGKKEQAIPLSLVMCKVCTFVQLGQSVDPDRMYRQFWYKSGINESMRRTLQDIVAAALARVNSYHTMSVLDIGSNDGTLLSFYSGFIRTVGFDPAENLVQEAKETARTQYIYADYFTQKYEKELWELTGKEGFRIITAIAMFYDLEEPTEFLKLIKRVLHPDGIFVVQMNYLLSMLEQNAVDNIAHEHLGYYSLKALKALVESVGLSVIAAEINDVNGGSIKVTIAHNTDLQTSDDIEGVNKLLDIEAESNLSSPETYKKFGEEMRNIIARINCYIHASVHKGNKVYLYGASTRGSTLMQLLDQKLIPYIKGVAERNPEKCGLRMVGTWLPIFDESQCRNDANVFIVLPYHFRDAILARENRTMLNGVEFMFPLPEPAVYSGERI